MCRSNQKMILIIMIFGQDTPRLVVPPFYEMNLEYCGQVRRFGRNKKEILYFVPLSGSQEHLLFLRCDPQFLWTLIRIHPKKGDFAKSYHPPVDSRTNTIYRLNNFLIIENARSILHPLERSRQNKGDVSRVSFSTVQAHF